MVHPIMYRENYPDLIIELMTKGYLNCQLYSALDICKDTFYEWIKRYDEFKEAYARGRPKAEAFWANKLQEMVLKGDDKGCKACIMILNNNFGWGKDDFARTSNNTQININSMNVVKSFDDYKQLLIEVKEQAKELNALDILPDDMDVTRAQEE